MTGETVRIGLVVRSAPYCGRSGRDQLDLALAAASMGYEVELFFTGPGALQLLPGQQPESAGLPPGIRGWPSLVELGPVHAWVLEDQHQELCALAREFTLELQPATGEMLAERIARCDHVVVA
ncbi:MAG: hypothetical protein HKN58_09760 [Xanthomonadales bacterium]|nr:hypothetical protein [Xanthomonadales bacterium]